MSRAHLPEAFLGLLTALSLALVGSSSAQITFERTYGDSLEDNGRSVWQASDGGYIVTGAARSFSAGSSDVYLVRTDSLGDTLWTRTYRDSTFDEGNHVRQTSDGGYIMTGWTRDYGSLYCDMYLLKVDSAGQTVWEKTYGWDGRDEGNCVLQAVDGGYVIVGSASIPGLSDEVYLLKTDGNGNAIWGNLYGSDVWDKGLWVEQTRDSGYIIVGSTSSVPFPIEYGVYLIRIGPSGFREWERTYGNPGTNVGYCVRETMDNGYIIGGATRPPASANSDAYLIKTDSLGNALWERSYGGTKWDVAECVLQTPGGGYVVLGSTESIGAGSGDLWFFKMDSLGSMLWSRTYGGTATDGGGEVSQTSDGGFILAGLTRSFGSGQGDVYLVKTDEYGLVGTGRDAMVLSLDSPPDTVFVDSTYGVRATVRNFGNLTVTFDVVATVDGYTDTTQVQNLDPGLSAELSFQDWQVPSSDSTNYTMTVCTHVIDDIDTTNDCMQKTIFAYDPTGVEEELTRPSGFGFHLSQNEPNPFHRSTVIQYSLPTECDVTLSVYDATGRLMETIVDQRQGAGVFQARWDARGHTDGVYFCRLTAGNLTETRKMVLVR